MNQTERYLNENILIQPYSEYCRTRDVNFITISWENILNDLDKNNSLQNELYLFVNDYIDQIFIEEQIMILNNPEVPKIILNLYKKVSIMKHEFELDGFKATRMSQSANFYGFFINYKHFKFWLGVYMQPWEMYGSPVILQFRKEWIEGENDQFMKNLKEKNFRYSDKYEYILPFTVDRIDEWKEMLQNTLNDFI